MAVVAFGAVRTVVAVRAVVVVFFWVVAWRVAVVGFFAGTALRCCAADDTTKARTRNKGNSLLIYRLVIFFNTSSTLTCLYLLDTVVRVSQLLSVFTPFILMVTATLRSFCVAFV